MMREGAGDLNKLTNIIFVVLLIAMILFTPRVVEIFDSNRARVGHNEPTDVAVGRSRSLLFNTSTSSTQVELLHPNLYENAKWKEILEITSKTPNVGLNISIRYNPVNKVSYKLINSGIEKSINETGEFNILVPGDRLELTVEEGDGCSNCASLTFYEIWNFTGLSGSLIADFSIDVIDWGNNLFSLMIAGLLVALFVASFWVLTKKSLSRKGFDI